MKKRFRIFSMLLIIAAVSISGLSLFSQDGAAGSTETVKPVKEEATVETEKGSAPKTQNFFDIIAGSGPIGIVIWGMIFLTSAATLGLIIDSFINIRQGKIMPMDLIEGVRASLAEGSLDVALETCEVNPGPMSNILMAGFNNVSEGFDVIMDSVSTAAEIEGEKLMQRVNFLNLCGSIAPMLGLMGTVTGMVQAFETLGTATGSEKAQLLAIAISQALYTTAVGLLISVPAILAFTFTRNSASKIILNMESLTYDLIKVLRGAEVVDEPYEEEAYPEE